MRVSMRNILKQYFLMVKGKKGIGKNTQGTEQTK